MAEKKRSEMDSLRSIAGAVAMPHQCAGRYAGYSNLSHSSPEKILVNLPSWLFWWKGYDMRLQQCVFLELHFVIGPFFKL